MSDELDVQIRLNRDLQQQQKLVFNDPRSINPYKQIFLMYEERLLQISRITDDGIKRFATPNKKFTDFNFLKEQRKTHIRMFRELKASLGPDAINKEKQYLTPGSYTPLFTPRKKTNSFDLDLIWNEKTSYIDQKLRCLAALVDKPNIYILSVVYQDPFALNVYDIDIGMAGKYTSITKVLLEKSNLELKPARVAIELNANSYLIPASDLHKATTSGDYELPSGKDNISACVFGTLDEILDLCDVAYTDEPTVVGFAAAPLEEVIRILELYIHEGKFLQFLTYKSAKKPLLQRQGKQRLIAAEYDQRLYDPSYEELERKLIGAEMSPTMNFVEDFDKFMDS